MKKIACFLLTAVMMAAIAVPALAADVSASYDHGKLTVSTSSSNWYRIVVDGVGTMRSLTPSVPSLTFEYELSDGEHRVGISSDVVGGGTITIKVVNGVSVNGSEDGKGNEQSSEPAKPVEHDTHTPVEIPAKEPTCTVNGRTVGQMCKEGGEILLEQEIIPALGHRYAVAGKNGDVITYKCVRCGEIWKAYATDAVENRFGNIVTDKDGNPVSYTAGIKQSNKKVILITVKKPAGKATMALDISLITQLYREGFSSVEFVNGKADLVIPLNSISKSWFGMQEAVISYLFTTDSESDILRVEGQTYGGKIGTTQDTGLVLK